VPVGASPDDVIGLFAGMQDGVVARWQLLGESLSPRAVEHRLERGSLRAVHRGVYVLAGLPPTWMRLARAAQLACGPAAVVSHESAAYATGRTEREPGRIEITAPGRGPNSTAAYRVHRVPAFLDDRDVRFVDGLPVMSPARTLLDRSARMTDRELQREYDELVIARELRPRDVPAAVDRAPHRRAAARLRALAERELLAPADFRSDAERRLKDLYAAGGIERPEYNALVLGHAFDAVWRAEMYVVELDGFAVHTREAKFERDREKADEIQDRGWRVDRVTWTMLTERPARVLVRTARALIARK
jgi:hypothetical protein